MDQKWKFEVGDVVKLKKPHPCGSHEWEILRVGADFRLKCMGCGHQVMTPLQIAGTVSSMLGGKEATTLNVDGDDVSVMVEYPEQCLRGV